MTPKKLKVDFHRTPRTTPRTTSIFSSEQLIDRAAGLGYDAIAITNHNIITDRPGLADYAAARNVLLVPGVELTLSGNMSLVINPPFAPEPPGPDLTRRAFEPSSAKRVSSSLPIPYYPGLKCLWSKLTENISLFDAVEFSFFYSRLIDPNQRAVGRRQGVGKAAHRDIGLPQHLAGRVRPILSSMRKKISPRSSPPSRRERSKWGPLPCPCRRCSGSRSTSPWGPARYSPADLRTRGLSPAFRILVATPGNQFFTTSVVMLYSLGPGLGASSEAKTGSPADGSAA